MKIRDFTLPNQKIVIDYLNNFKYKRTFPSRDNDADQIAVDQKFTFDTLYLTCRYILKITQNKIYFSNSDFYKNNEIKNEINKIKRKYGDEIRGNQDRENDKIFKNSLEVLVYLDILCKTKTNKKIIKYWIKESNRNSIKILEILANDLDACLAFVCIHIFNFLKVFNLENDIEETIQIITKENSARLTIQNDPLKQAVFNKILNNRKDRRQIYRKIINPILYLFQTYSLTKGELQTEYYLTYFKSSSVKDKISKKNSIPTHSVLKYLKKASRVTYGGASKIDYSILAKIGKIGEVIFNESIRNLSQYNHFNDLLNIIEKYTTDDIVWNNEVEESNMNYDFLIKNRKFEIKTTTQNSDIFYLSRSEYELLQNEDIILIHIFVEKVGDEYKYKNHNFYSSKDILNKKLFDISPINYKVKKNDEKK